MKNICYIILAFIGISFFFFGCKSDSNYKPSQLRIAYNVLVDPATEDYEIFVMDMNGENPVNISTNPSIDWAYSSFGNQLFVISDRDTCSRCYFLYETDTKGSYWKKISKTLIQDSWVSHRANGKELIVKPAGTANETFQIIDINGNILSSVDPKMDYFNDPCFSPDGESIIFRGYNGALDKSQEAELYSFNLATGEKKRITNHIGKASNIDDPLYWAGPARWNPRNDKITYSSNFKNISTIISMDITEKKTKSLTQKNVKAIWHDVSPDGNFLAYDGQLDFKADSATTHIFIMDFEKCTSKKLTSGDKFKQGPVFVYDK